MCRAFLTTQWEWRRGIVVFATVLAFALPIAAVNSAAQTYTPMQFVEGMQRWGVGYALVAAGLGLLVALAAWAHDHRGRHTYALSLPVSRSRYTLMRFGAGAIFLL